MFEPSAVPAAVAPVVPAAPAAVAPPAVSQQAQELPPLDRNLLVELATGQSATLGQMAEAYQELQKRSAAPAPVPAEDLEELALMRRALKEGDPAASLQLWERFKPVSPETPEQSAQVMREQLKALAQQVQSLTQATTQGQQAFQQQQVAAGQQWITQQLQAHKDKFPHLAGHPGGTALLVSKLNEIETLARARGVDTATLDQATRQRVVAEAFQWVENDLKNTVSWAKGFSVTPNGQPGRPVQALADQGPRSGQGQLQQAFQRARFGIHPETGQVIDRSTGQVVMQAQGAGFIPSMPVVPTQGMAMGPAEPPMVGPVSVRSMREKMAQRIQEL